MKTFIFLFCSFFLTITLFGQSSKDAAVMVHAIVTREPNSITLIWNKTPNVTSYLLYRKSPKQISWGAPIKTFTDQDTSYVDTKVNIGTLYEYRIDKTASNYTGGGYITCGIDIPAIENRGIIILAIDSIFIDSLNDHIALLIKDLEGDGYAVKYFYTSRTASVVSVKDKIRAIYAEDVLRTTSLLLLGHIPVPYSGNLNPDGHQDHVGAWPTDMYYADLDGMWTDNGVVSPTANSPRIVNKIGDGKFDQSIITGNLELQTGRVDFYDMPAFGKSEIQLMRLYLTKDHAYKHKLFSVAKKAVVDDNFGYFSGEAFAASGYNNFSNLVGPENVVSDDYFTTLSQQGDGYLWSYGCGGGWYNGAGGVGSTDGFASADLNNVFTLLFGSYFGDWDVQNSFLRAPLAQGKTLTCSWSGRPHHQYHHMTLGQSIGYSFLKSLNNNNYFPNIYGISGKWIHNNLMGDPTLRNDVLAPPQSVELVEIENGVQINWQASSENNVSYKIYYKKIAEPFFAFLVEKDSITLEHTFECIKDTGTYVFMVRAVKLVNTPAGTYFNISQGSLDTIGIKKLVKANAGFIIEPTSSNKVSIINTSSNYTNLVWSCTNGQIFNTSGVNFVFDSSGLYTITLIASNACYSDTAIAQVNIIISKTIDESSNNVIIYPIPAFDHLEIKGLTAPIVKANIVDALGRKKQTIIQASNYINIEGYSPGIYILELTQSDGKKIAKAFEIVK